MVNATVDIVQWSCVVCGDYCDYSNSRYSAMVLCCVGDYCGYSNSRYSAMVPCCVEFIVVTATVDFVQWYCVVCGVYCGYSNSRYSAKLLCCVWILFWLQQQKL